MGVVMMVVVMVAGLVGGAWAAQLPHIIFIVADDLGWNDVGWHNARMHTPHLHRLAREGILLNNSYVQKLCSPSRSAIMSGYFPFHIGLQHSVILWRQRAGLPVELKLLPQSLQEMGYATHAIGKWHLGYCSWSYTPTQRGFHTFLGFYNADQTYYGHRSEGAYDFRRNRAVDTQHAGVYSTKVFSERAISIIEQHNTSQPLFLYLAFQAVHYPLQVPIEYEEKYCSHIKNATRRTFCGMAASMDEAVGRVVDKLQALGFMDNLLLVFTSDNGGGPEVGGNNWPLRGAKDTLWEGGNRAASFLYSPTLLPNTGGVYEGMMHAVDWYPTLMSLVGGTPPQGIDGVSQWDAIVEDSESPRTQFVYNVDRLDQNAAIRIGDWKLIQGNPGEMNDWYPDPGSQEQEGEEQDVPALGPQDFQLFNIREDPRELKNVAGEQPDVLRQMKEALQEVKATEVAPNFPPDDPAADPSNYGNVWSPGWC